MDIKKIGILISTYRKKLGYTQDELGEILGVSGKAVSKWERGLSLPDATLFNKIAVTLKISIAQFLAGNAEDISRSSNIVCPEKSENHFAGQNCNNIDISDNKSLGVVSPYLFGNNLEHTRSCVCNGISAQMLKNRKFVGKPSVMEGVASGWFVIGDRTFCSLGDPYTKHYEEHYHMQRVLECNSQQVLCCDKGVFGGIGQHGITVEKGKSYIFATVAKCVKDVVITVKLTGHNSDNFYASNDISIKGGDEWEHYEVVLDVFEDDNDADITITFNEQVTLCVGSVSLMNKDNFRGMRVDVIDAMKQMGITVLRWPGGNFAGEYNWFDGLLPVDERAPVESYLHLETQPHTLGYDFHEINTDDFVALCREIGAEPFITINVAWNTPEENAAWVEYCNGDETTKYGKMRIERGFKEPYNVLLWSLGNEAGYGHMEGDNTAAGYSRIAGQNGRKMLEVCDNLTLCSSGPYPDEDWVTYSAKPLSTMAPLVSLHYYAKCPSYRDLSDLENEYKTCLSGVSNMRQKINEMRSVLPVGQKISFDEWNVWYGWYRPSCVIDGIYAALAMHMFISEAQKGDIEFVCHFEAVNESAIKVTPKSVSFTALGEMLKVMKLHSNGNLIYADDFTVVTKKDNITTVTVINSSCNDVSRFKFTNAGNCIKKSLYSGKTLMPHSTFEIAELPCTIEGTTFETELAPLGVAVIQFEQ